MHYSIDCYVAKALPMNYQITAPRPFMHGMHVAKTRFVNLLSTEVLNSLEKIVMATDGRAFHGTTQRGVDKITLLMTSFPYKQCQGTPITCLLYIGRKECKG